MLYEYHDSRKNKELTFREIRLFLDDRLEHRIDLKGLDSDETEYELDALMLSDQCPWHYTFITSEYTKVLDGPLPVQIEKCMKEIGKTNRPVRVSHRSGLCKRFPVQAVREALVNAMIHFDATADDDISVISGEDVIKIISPGGVCMNEKDGRVVCRNPKIAELMVEAGYARMKGKGIPIIRMCYSATGMIPSVERTEDSFMICLPSIECEVLHSDQKRSKIYTCVLNKPGISLSELSNKTLVSQYELRRVLCSMEDEGLAFTMGLGDNMMAFSISRNSSSAESLSTA